MANIRLILYKIKRLGNSIFTYDCACCKKTVRGKCLCEECTEKLIPAPNYHNGYAFAYEYQGPAKDAMLCFKFGQDSEFCFDTICDWLSEGYTKLEEKSFDAVISVPSYKKKSTRFSEVVQKFCLMENLPFHPELLKKIRQTQKQHSLPAEERRTNLIGAFKADASVKGKTVLLVDDIYTTGSTAKECVNALYEKGAEEVCVLAVLKTR